MVTLKVTVEDEQADALKKLLSEVSFVKTVEQERQSMGLQETGTPYERLVNIQKILSDAKGQDLFKEIEDPSEWQRQIRKEWDRDF